jgi:hypothetical protein
MRRGISGRSRLRFPEQAPWTLRSWPDDLASPAHEDSSSVLLEHSAALTVQRLIAPDMFSGWGVRTMSSASRLQPHRVPQWNDVAPRHCDRRGGMPRSSIGSRLDRKPGRRRRRSWCSRTVLGPDVDDGRLRSTTSLPPPFGKRRLRGVPVPGDARTCRRDSARRNAGAIPSRLPTPRCPSPWVAGPTRGSDRATSPVLRC